MVTRYLQVVLCHKVESSSLKGGKRETSSLVHVDILFLHSIRQFQVKVVQEICKARLHCCCSQINGGTYPSTRTKWQELEMLPFELNGSIHKPLWDELPRIVPAARVSSYRPSINLEYCCRLNFVTIDSEV
ncbi:hypothetical protein PanWU01x14_293520 [Parasponia andersonii]|uniref:Uncharacterized protein n=1 Tax=Parasponia andersonii TaxID=3476 RepID=A0A2P5AWI3_PARAD|nr:hypothetical protein PanWU01x14_293520 [Parasponia andersonii]